jgi:hypothetical protein
MYRSHTGKLGLGLRGAIRPVQASCREVYLSATTGVSTGACADIHEATAADSLDTDRASSPTCGLPGKRDETLIPKAAPPM